jgi:hypothetical protein
MYAEDVRGSRDGAQSITVRKMEAQEMLLNAF